MTRFNRKGSVLILIYILIVMLLVMGASLLSNSVSEKTFTGKALYASRAFWLAESGIQRGLWEMRHNATLFSASWSASETLGNALGSYNVTYDASAHTINATGYFPNATASDKITRSVSINVTNPGVPYFSYAAFGKKSIYLNNNADTDSYNSSQGSYAISHCNGADCRGDIGTNGNAVAGKKVAGAVTVDNNGDVKGNVSSGGDNTTMSISGTVSGSRIYNKTVELPSVQVPTDVSAASYTAGANISGSSLVLDNNEVISITPGPDGIIKLKNVTLDNNAMLTITSDAQVYLTGFIKVNNNAQLKIASNATVTFYVDGPFDFNNNGNINNLGQKPANFTLFSNYVGNITVANNVDFFGAIYAPNVNLTLNNNAATYGAVLGNTLNITNNAAIHYDTELSRITNSTDANVNQTSWRQI